MVQRAVTGQYRQLRPLLFSIAYRMLGSAVDAEDVVQEAFLRLHREPEEGLDIVSPKNYLSTVVTHLCIDELRSARARRVQYIGTWLPEPLLTHDDSEERFEQTETLSLTLLILLESLSPLERAVFLLRDVFDYSYAEIGEIIGRSVANCRQVAMRARRRLKTREPRFAVSPDQSQELAALFFAACQRGDADGLIRLLTRDVVAYFDGGGHAPAPPLPVVGREAVARIVLGLAAKANRAGLTTRAAEVNGMPGALIFDPSGALVAVMALEMAAVAVRGLYIVSNPLKLRHLPGAGTARRLG